MRFNICTTIVFSLTHGTLAAVLFGSAPPGLITCAISSRSPKPSSSAQHAQSSRVFTLPRSSSLHLPTWIARSTLLLTTISLQSLPGRLQLRSEIEVHPSVSIRLSHQDSVWRTAGGAVAPGMWCFPLENAIKDLAFGVSSENDGSDGQQCH